MSSLVTCSNEGSHLWAFDGKDLTLAELLTTQTSGCSVVVTKADNVLFVFSKSPETITCRVCESALNLDNFISEVTYTMPHPVESFSLSKYGTILQVYFSMSKSESEHNFALFSTATGKLLCSTRSTVKLSGFRSMAWPYCISDDEDYIMHQEGWLLKLQYYEHATEALTIRGYMNIVPRDQPLRLVAYFFTPVLQVSSAGLEKYSVVICVPSHGKYQGYVLVYKPSQFIELSDEEVTVGQDTEKKPMAILDKISVKPYMFQVMSTCDMFIIKPGDSGAWFLLLEKTDVDKSKHDNYYGVTVLRYYCILTKSISMIAGVSGYIHNFSIRPISPTEQQALADKSLDKLVELFVVASGTVPPKVCTYTVTLRNINRTNPTVDLERDIQLGSMGINSTSWDHSGRYLLLRGEAGMNGEVRIITPVINNEPRYIAKGTIYSKTHACFSPRGDYVMYQVTRPRFTVDNGIEIFNMELKSLASKEFESLFSAQFIPYCKSNYAAKGFADAIEGVYLANIRTETKKYVPPSQRKK